MEKSLRERTAKGLFWGGFNNLFQQVIQLAFGVFMMRILSPKEFGLVAMLGIFTAIATSLQESGFSIALINRKEIDQESYSSVFWTNVLISLSLYFLLFFSAPLIASFYDKPLLINLSRFLFLSFVFSALGIVQNTILTKQIEIKKLAIINLVSLLVACSIGLILALLHFSYWAVAVQLVALSLSKTIMLWLTSKWRPASLIKKEPLKEMLPFSIKILLSTILSQLSTGMYSLLLGKFYNENQVGYYSQAYKWYSIPLGVVLGIVSSVTVPVFAEVNHDSDRHKHVFRKMLRFTSFVTFPIILGFAFVARETILILVTDEWMESIPILQLLCITGVFSPILVLYINLLTSKGHSGIILFITIFYSILMITILLATIHFGIITMIISTGIFYLFYLLSIILVTKKYIGLAIGSFFKDVFPFLTISVAVFTAVYFITYMITNIYILLAAKIALSILLYLVIMKVSKIVIFQESMDFVKEKLFNKKSNTQLF